MRSRRSAACSPRPGSERPCSRGRVGRINFRLVKVSGSGARPTAAASVSFISPTFHHAVHSSAFCAVARSPGGTHNLMDEGQVPTRFRCECKFRTCAYRITAFRQAQETAGHGRKCYVLCTTIVPASTHATPAACHMEMLSPAVTTASAMANTGSRQAVTTARVASRYFRPERYIP